MKIILQRVKHARCIIDNHEHAAIKNGLLLLVGFGKEDEDVDLKQVVRKINLLRCFEDDNGKMNLSLSDLDYEVLAISQFTLYGECHKGNRPSFIEALAPTRAQELYHELISEFQNQEIRVKSGVFAANMQIELVNDGPVTLILNF